MIPYKRPTKAELLRRYNCSEPQFFIHYLGFADRASCGLPPTFDWADKDGHVLFMGDTWELASGQRGGFGINCDEPAIRVLIKEGTTKTEALALLSKIMVWIEKDGMPN